MSALLKVPTLPTSLVSASDVKKRRLSRASRGSSGALAPADSGSRAMDNDDEAELRRLEQRKAAAAVGGGVSQASTSSSSARLGRPQLLLLYSDVLKLSSSGRLQRGSVWSLPLIDNMIDLITQTGDADDADQLKHSRSSARPPQSDAAAAAQPGTASASPPPASSSQPPAAPASSRRSLSSVTRSTAGSRGSGPAPVNFAKASCTLDASVLLYSGRVDSVHKDAYRMAGGLSRDQPPAALTQDDDGEEGERTGKAIRRRRAMSTLEPQPDSLKLKAAERQLEADPFFKRTSAAFDAGGSSGMLLHQLSVYHQLDIALDGQEIVHSGRPQQAEEADAALSLQLDLSALRHELETAAPDWRRLSVCPLMWELQAMKAALDGSRLPDQPDNAAAALEGGCDADDGVGEDLQSLHAQLDAAIAQEQSLDALIAQQQDDEAEQSDGEQQPAAERQQAATASACAALPSPSLLTGLFGTAGAARQPQTAALLPAHSSWASLSLSHWKLRQPPVSSPASAASRPTRASKAAAPIDFFSPPPPPSAFPLVSRRQAARCTELSQATLDRNSAQQLALLLPASALDTADLLRLATKPTLALHAGRGRAAEEQADEAAGRPLEQGEDAAGDGQDAGDECGMYEQPAVGSAAPPPPAAPVGYSLLPAPAAVGPMSIGYAQVAKRVDVKALKAGLLLSIRQRQQQRQREEETAAAAAVPFQEAIDSLSAAQLSPAASPPLRCLRLTAALGCCLLPVCCCSVAAGRYPSSQLRSVSVAYCFICCAASLQ